MSVSVSVWLYCAPQTHAHTHTHTLLTRRTMTAMAKSFWAENRRVSSRKTKAALGIEWRHPSYREGLRACLKEEAESLERERRSAV